MDQSERKTYLQDFTTRGIREDFKLEKQLLVPLLLAARVSSKSHPSALQLPCRLRRFAGRSGGVIFVSLFVALSFQVSGHT